MSEQNNQRKPNTIVLFQNNRRGNDNAPVVTGTVCIDVAMINQIANGAQTVNLDVSIWSKTAKSGVQYWSGNVKKLEPRFDNNPTVEMTAARTVEHQPPTVTMPVNATYVTPDNDLPF